ncbi:hypothetical protein GALMADRAFT_239024 [Galerina marginata CBS 339.88]|uniref:F-box domain-containing protein n=1 Tax=Galerina marginata (strain CBS 339.88) TaxID=685588 RepID=A0A067TLG2_GALM3|nr:hypothetical protein GALMADRAFT_239024 [Galerina marginata CBS 339.88]
MSSGIQLPIEVLELIVDNVNSVPSEDRQALVNCSYANQVLGVMCQKRIFRNIQIKQEVDRVAREGYLFTEARGSDGERFLELIKTEKSRHLASYVRNLTINIVHALEYNHGRSELNPRNHNSTDPHFPLYAIVPRLQNLKRFAVITSDPGMAVEWDTMESRLLTFLSDIAQQVPELDFRFFLDPGMEIFSNCPSLEVLLISAVHTNTTAPPPSKAKLRFFDFGSHSPSQVKGDWALSHFDPIYSPLDLTHLTGLKLSSIVFFASDVNSILALCANTLESLDLRVGLYGECKLSYRSGFTVSRPEVTLPNLSSLHILRSLTLRTQISSYASPDFYWSNTPTVAAILQTLPRNIYSPFKLVVDTGLLHCTPDHLARFPWSEIVDVLCQDPLSGSLATVEFTFHQRLKRYPSESISDTNRLAEILDRNDALRQFSNKTIRLATKEHDFDY